MLTKVVIIRGTKYDFACIIILNFTPLPLIIKKFDEESSQI